jgi:hypothetical protein
MSGSLNMCSAHHFIKHNNSTDFFIFMIIGLKEAERTRNFETEKD